MMPIAIVLLTLTTYDYDTGTLLRQITDMEVPGFSVSGDKMEDCRIAGVRMAHDATEYFKARGYRNVSTNVNCHWVRGGKGT